MTESTDPASLVRRLAAATNAHDLDALTACFADDYLNETPAHPARGFRGAEQVRRNWAQLFAGIPDLSARILATVRRQATQCGPNGKCQVLAATAPLI